MLTSTKPTSIYVFPRGSGQSRHQCKHNGFVSLGCLRLRTFFPSLFTEGPAIFCSSSKILFLLVDFPKITSREERNNEHALRADHKGAIYCKDSDALFCL